MESTWRVGTLTVPSSPGSVSVAGLGGTPAAVFFYGANWTTEDVVLTGTGYTLFRGMAASDASSPGDLLQNAAAAGPTGNQHAIDNYAILNLTTAGNATLLYRASLLSLDADGFTVDFDVAAAGGYKVIYIALFDVANAASYVGTSDNSTIPLGFAAGASLLHGAWAGPVASAGDRTQEWYGGAAYAVNQAAGVQAFTFPTSFAGQYNIGTQVIAPNVSIVQGGSFVGPFLSTSNIISTVSGTDLSFIGDGGNGGMIVAWDDDDSATGGLSIGSSIGDIEDVTGLPFAPGLVLGYSASNEAPGQGTGALGALGFSVITPDFQWAALVEAYDPGYTTFGTGRGSIQSFANGIIPAIDDTAYCAATVELTDDGFVATTTVDDIPTGAWVWHAFGHPQLNQWIPRMYRLVRRYSGRPEPIPPSMMLLEDGGRIVLEDDSGFLTL